MLAQNWAHNPEGTLIRGGRGRIVWNGRFFSFFFFFVFFVLFCFVLVFGFFCFEEGGGVWRLSQTIILIE